MKVVSAGPLTAKKIESLKARAERYEESDASTGLRLRVSPSGIKSWRWPVHTPEGQRVITLGRWSAASSPGCLTLAQARDWLEKLKEAHRTGRLEAVEKELNKLLKPSPRSIEGVLMVSQVAEAFLKNLDRKRPEQALRPIEHDILPAIGTKAVTEVTSLDCRRIVEAVVARGSTTQAGVVLAVMKQMFKFALERADIEVNPAARFENPRALGVVRNVRQRVLSNTEIVLLWRALDSDKGMTPAVRSGIKLLLLLGVRSGELLKAQWAEVDLTERTLTVPVAHQKLTREAEKTARPWAVPLGPTSVHLLTELKALAQIIGSPFVLASFVGQGAALTDKTLVHTMGRLFKGKPAHRAKGGRIYEARPAHPLLAGLPPATIHDCRRSFRSGLSDLQIPWHTAELCLMHSLGKVDRTYRVSSALEERRAAIEKWDAHIQALLAR